VLDAGAGVACVRLTCANGVVLEDDTEHGVVLFVSDEPATPPVSMELLDDSGALVARHDAFGSAPVGA